MKKKTKLSENRAPEFQYKFKSHSLDSGAHLSLRCSAYGSPLPQIHWFFFDRRLNKPKFRSRYRIGDYVDRNGIIVSYVNISSVSVEDGGLYSCQAFNDIASISHSANVYVYGPPFVHQMDNLTVVTATKVQLDCPASGYPLEGIYWRKDGKEFLPSRRVKSYRNGTLSIIDAHLDDEGWYECIAKAKDNKIASASLYVDIVEKPVINPFMFGSDLREGMRTTVVCSVLSGESPISVNWFKNGQLVKHMHPEVEILSLGEFTSTLRFASVQRNHSGNYTCKASSVMVSSNYTAPMVVQAFPKWLLKPSPVYSVLKGRNIVIDCQAEGFPAPIHHWKLLKESTGLSSPEYVTIVSGPHIHVLENGSLAIIDAAKSDEGDYVCEANNGIGATITAAVKLRVNKPVHFDKNFEVIKVQKGQRAQFKCDAVGDPPILVSWAKDRVSFTAFNAKTSKYVLNEQMTPEGLSSHITIDFVEVSDSAFFTCAASNPFGKDEKNIQLLVQGPPEAPRNLKITEVQSRQIVLSWFESSNGNSPLLSYLIQYIHSNGSWNHRFDTTAVPAKELTHSINGLTPSSEYKIRVIAENVFGKSLPSEEITVKTSEEAPSFTPANVKVESINSRTLQVHWKHFKEAVSVDGFNIGYREIDTFSSTGFNAGHREMSHFPVHKSSEIYTFKSVRLESDSETKDTLRFTINSLKKNTKYGIIIQAFNRKGLGPSSDEVIADTLEFDPPEAVNPRVTDVSQNSLSLIWESDGQNPVSGYAINYKSESGDWEEQKVVGSQSSFTLENLRCGTKYQITMTASNKAGRSTASDLITAFTVGS
ncbi:cell adhesion molecule-like protein, partial [Leptotrombidium deliense]